MPKKCKNGPKYLYIFDNYSKLWHHHFQVNFWWNGIRLKLRVQTPVKKNVNVCTLPPPTHILFFNFFVCFYFCWFSFFISFLVFGSTPSLHSILNHFSHLGNGLLNDKPLFANFFSSLSSVMLLCHSCASEMALT